MGPFVPDIITSELNLIVGAVLGVAFGFLLEQAGFSSSRKLTGLFYGVDFTVLRVFFSAGVTAMAGVIVLSQLGLLDTSVIYVHPTFLWAALAGGAVMGLGFVIGGYCPGTSFCGAAVGKVDAMVFILGGLLGVLVFGEAYPWLRGFYQSGSFGDATVPALLGVRPGLIGLLLILVALAAFVLVGRIERRVNPSSLAREFPRRSHQFAGLAALLLGLGLALLPEREERLLKLAFDPAYQHEYPVARMGSDELAFRILDQDPSLLLIDVREPAAFAETSLPQAVNVPLDEMFGQGWHDVLGASRKKKLFFAQDERQAVAAATLAGLLGYSQLAVLVGGLEEFSATILQASDATSELSASERDTQRFRLRAAEQISALIAARGRVEPVRKRSKKVLGGCGV